jgi:methionyl-tRNA formyltransferase
LRRLITEKSVQVVQVVSQPDRPAGRGRRVLPTPIAQAAADYRLPLLRTNDINAEKLPAADLLLVIAFGQKIGPALARAGGAAVLGLGLGLGSINLHASLLPRHRGAAPIQHAILAGDRQTGNSIIRLDEKMDAGAVLAQSSVTIGEVETAGELHDRLADDGAALMIQTIEALAAGRAQEKPQDAALATLAPKLTHAAGKIDWTLSADQIARRIRAMWPWPGCRVQIVDPAVDAAGLAAGAEERNKATLARARALDRPAGTIRAGMPGVIDDHGHVMAGDGRQVEVIDLQPQGGRLMKLADYARGRPWRAGMHVKSIG